MPGSPAAWGSASRRICCATASLPTCWKAASIPASSKPSSGIAASIPLPAMPPSRRLPSAQPPVRSTGCWKNPLRPRPSAARAPNADAAAGSGAGRHFSTTRSRLPVESLAALASAPLDASHRDLPHPRHWAVRGRMDVAAVNTVTSATAPAAIAIAPSAPGLARAQWLQKRTAELLPVEYFHVVFTVLPGDRLRRFLVTRKPFTISSFAPPPGNSAHHCARPQTSGSSASDGFFAVLHTWGQNLHLHPHLHCVVPGGGLSADQALGGMQRPGFFLAVRVLSPPVSPPSCSRRCSRPTPPDKSTSSAIWNI